jgi:hypothetical protein
LPVSFFDDFVYQNKLKLIVFNTGTLHVQKAHARVYQAMVLFVYAKLAIQESFVTFKSIFVIHLRVKTMAFVLATITDTHVHALCNIQELIVKYQSIFVPLIHAKMVQHVQ